MVECSASDPEVWVRFPLPAPKQIYINKVERLYMQTLKRFFICILMLIIILVIRFGFAKIGFNIQKTDSIRLHQNKVLDSYNYQQPIEVFNPYNCQQLDISYGLLRKIHIYYWYTCGIFFI